MNADELIAARNRALMWHEVNEAIYGVLKKWGDPAAEHYRQELNKSAVRVNDLNDVIRSYPPAPAACRIPPAPSVDEADEPAAVVEG